ncbi:MAG: gliding motility-associated C-terminal domain-containing protein, partial [Chitinophagaceae bacterium]
SLPYNWNNQSITAAGNYTATLISATGCDSIATLHLIVKPIVTGEETTSICASSLPYNWNNQSINAAGNYTATLISAAGCDSIVKLHLIVKPIVTGEETITICASALPYNWNNQFITAAGNYTATLISATGCDSIVKLHLIVKPIVTGEETITICASALPYNWNNQFITAAGNYTATLISATGCDSIATLHLIVATQPKIVTSAISSCATASLMDASVTAGSDPGLVLSYWLDAAAVNAVPDPTAVPGGTFYIKGINSSGCYSIKPVIVTIVPAPLFVITNPDIVCEPATVDLTADYITAGSDQHLTFTYWMDAAATIPLANPHAVGGAGAYYIKAAASGGCDFVRLKEVSIVTVRGEKSVRYPTVTVSPNESVQLAAREPGLVNSYTWYPEVGLNSYNRKDPTFRYDQNAEYTVRIESGNGCPVMDTIMVVIRPGAQTCVSDIFVPKAWSPNNDGHNDKLYPIAVCIKEIKYFRVFNRWGQLVFETNIVGQGWDGIFHGEPQMMNTYTWRLEAIGEDGKYHKREGNSVLIR